jgi:hypothetical protein
VAIEKRTSTGKEHRIKAEEALVFETNRVAEPKQLDLFQSEKHSSSRTLSIATRGLAVYKHLSTKPICLECILALWYWLYALTSSLYRRSIHQVPYTELMIVGINRYHRIVLWCI